MRHISSAVFAATAILALLAAPSARAERYDKTFNERFEVEPGARLRLEHGDGDVEIVPWDQKTIEVDVRYRAELKKIGIGREGGFDVTMEQRGDTVTVIGRELPRGGVGIFVSNVDEHRYRIRAPRWVELDLEGDDGDVEIEGFAAPIAIEIDDGDVELRALDGPSIRVEMQDGSLEIDGARGELTVNADDGDVIVRGCRCTRADIEIQDGDLRAELDAADAPLDLRARSDDGTIDIDLAESIGATFVVSFDDGDVRIDVDGAEVERREHRVEGSFGDGDGRIRIDTGDGRVTLRRR